MIIDSSALIAIIEREVEADTFADLMSRAPCRLSAASWLETAIVLEGRRGRSTALDRIVAALDVEIVEVTLSQTQVARAAHARYGRWSGSPARLNFGDCFAYALAITTGEPLLFKGNDFTHTDVLPALR